MKISIRKCKKCGAALYKNATVCRSCGNKESVYPAFKIALISLIIGFFSYSFALMEAGVLFFTILPLISFLFTKSYLDRFFVILVYVTFFALIIYIDKTYWNFRDMIMGNTEDLFSLVILYFTGGFI